jgi:hypothetical protein
MGTALSTSIGRLLLSKRLDLQALQPADKVQPEQKREST